MKIIYEVPLFIFLILGIYTIYSLYNAAKPFKGGSIKSSFNWFIAATLFLILWSIDHMYHDLVPLPEKLKLFFHFFVSHGFLLIAMGCITTAASKTKNMFQEIGEK